MDYRDLLKKIQEYEDIEGFTPTHVNAYSVTREYGGPEEGGWYFDLYEPLESVEISSTEEIDKVKKELEDKYADQKEGDISSVLGGTDIRVFPEEHPAKRQPEERPFYENKEK